MLNFFSSFSAIISETAQTFLIKNNFIWWMDLELDRQLISVDFWSQYVRVLQVIAISLL